MSSQDKRGDGTEDLTAETQRTQSWRKELNRFSLRFLCVLCVSAVNAFCLGTSGLSATVMPPQQTTSLSIAVLDFGGSMFAAEAAAELSRTLNRNDAGLQFINRDLARAAARGIGYQGSLNLTLDEARDLGRSIGCDFYFAGRSEVIRRSPSTNTAYYEAYAAVFLISTRSGRLVMFDYTHAEAPTIDEAQQHLRRTLAANAARYPTALFRAHEDEEVALARRVAAINDEEADAILVADAPSEEKERASTELRLPQPYRRLRPPYTELAARAAVEATVDVAVEIKANGEVGKVEVRRWAGFGLDEAVIATVREMHFRPAQRTRTGEALPLGVLLRYNFRRPSESKQQS